MSRDEVVRLKGRVLEAYPNATFRVAIEDEGFEGHEITAHMAGKMRMHYIRIVQGDVVQVEVSPYNLEEGRIVYRDR